MKSVITSVSLHHNSNYFSVTFYRESTGCVPKIHTYRNPSTHFISYLAQVVKRRVFGYIGDINLYSDGWVVTF